MGTQSLTKYESSLGTNKPRKKMQQQKRRSWLEFSKKLRGSGKNKSPS
jgi:hypothetical protein